MTTRGSNGGGYDHTRGVKGRAQQEEEDMTTLGKERGGHSKRRRIWPHYRKERGGHNKRRRIWPH